MWIRSKLNGLIVWIDASWAFNKRIWEFYSY